MKDLHWLSATDLAAAIARREVSAREALAHLVARIERLNGPINAVVHCDLDQAEAAAAAADETLVNDGLVGPLHGVPMTVKDSFQTVGCVTTSGAPELAEYVPREDAWPVARLREAGAVPFAKTNLPIWAGDIQSYNDVYGTTNNPFDGTRTPGGSSGGSAAALAMGFSPIELGSDIGGSIRCPAHFSGVMGHKPSFGIVGAHGQIPGMPGTLSQSDLAVAGPMARHVVDLELGLDVLAGPDRWSTPAWRLELPPRRATGLEDFRLAAWLDDEHCPVDADTLAVLTTAVEAVVGAGGWVDTDSRPDFTLEEITSVFEGLLYAAALGGHTPAKIEHMAADPGDTALGRVKLATAARHRDWLSLNESRLQQREAWARFFDRYDAILLPVGPCAAIPHDHSQPQFGRTVEIDGIDRPYGDLFTWSAPAGAAYLPATVIPAGLGSEGLPIGVQIVGPFLHDRTTLHLAGLLAEVFGGCPRPPAALD